MEARVITSKQEKYNNLVMLRKSCIACKELSNPSRVENGLYDSQEIGPLTKWQGNLDSDFMLILQDWGCVDNFIKYKGTDINSVTNKALKTFLNLIGLSLTLPLDNVRKNSYIFTNSILCLKKGNDQTPVDKEWYRNCGPRFLKPLIEIVSPKVVICLGECAYNAVMTSYGRKPGLFGNAVNSHVPINLDNGIAAFPVYHCSNQRNRSINKQFDDWYYIAEWIKINIDN